MRGRKVLSQFFTDVSNMSLTAFLVLIRTITTVIGAVTHPVGGNAAVVPTFKLGGCAKFVCKKMSRRAQHFGEIIQFTVPVSHVFPCAVGSLRKNSLGFLLWFVFLIKIRVLEDNFVAD